MLPRKKKTSVAQPQRVLLLCGLHRHDDNKEELL